MIRSRSAHIAAPADATTPGLARLLLPALAIALIVVTLPGCYKRVVAARGMGADQYEVAEPYQENSKLDDWVFGQRPARNNSRLKNMNNVGE